MSGKYTDAQKKATTKYLNSLKSLSIRISAGEYDRYKSFAEQNNMSLRAFVLAAMNEKIERES